MRLVDGSGQKVVGIFDDSAEQSCVDLTIRHNKMENTPRRIFMTDIIDLRITAE
jgi:hypothetical protein